MKYRSTRGQADPVGFEQAILNGLAPDGGLYVPAHLPYFDQQAIAEMAAMDYVQLAYNIMYPFVKEDIAAAVLRKLLAKTYSHFGHDAVTPLVQLNEKTFVLELFHGPTLAFKDIALQFLGHLLDYILVKNDEQGLILGATSGDTGPAAMHGFRNCQRAELFLLHPHERISPLQRRQMTTLGTSNAHALAIEGTFDDCQHLVKEYFREQAALNLDKRRLIAVNSINWGRIMAQIVYYFYASTRLGAPMRAYTFIAPTGNFGNAYAAFLARQMGLPMNKIIIANNSNDILHRCLQHNDCSLRPVEKTIAPSMDISLPSNFERLLYDLSRQNSDLVNTLQQQLSRGHMVLSESLLQMARKVFNSYRCSDDELVAQMKKCYQGGYIADPHTAAGLAAADYFADKLTGGVVCLATADMAKFPESAQKALGFIVKKQPLEQLINIEERYQILPANFAALKKYIQSVLS